MPRGLLVEGRLQKRGIGDDACADVPTTHVRPQASEHAAAHRLVHVLQIDRIPGVPRPLCRELGVPNPRLWGTSQCSLHERRKACDARQMDATNLLLETESTHASAKRENSVTHRSRGQRAPDLLLEPHPPVAYMIREDGVATVARHTHGTFRFGARRDVKQLEALARSSPPIRPAQHRWSPRPKTRRGAVGVAQGRQASREGQALPSRSQLFFTRQVVNSVCARRPAPRFCCKLRVGTHSPICVTSRRSSEGIVTVRDAHAARR